VTESSKGVFLSYASEDVDAAERIADAFRAAGIDVWFDQSELRGGDAWDRRIRTQIRECRLFLPIVSSHTEARAEGYFRREWKLAIERTHDLSERVAFLVPIVIDDTPESKADVPDALHAVQWTRLPNGVPSAAFVARISSLLGSQHPAAHDKPNSRATAVRAPTRNPILPWVGVASGFLIVVLGGVYVMQRNSHGVAATQLSQTPAPIPHQPAAVSPTIPEKSVAVLPFVDMSEKKDQEYFSDGLSEELIDLLSKIPGLQVAARTSSFYFKGKSENIPVIANRLLVAHVLEGSVRKSGNRLRITVQLVRADNGYHLWSETYDRQFEDIFAIQDEIAGAVVKVLRVNLLGESLPLATISNSADAYTLYLKARALQARGLGSNLLTSTERQQRVGFLHEALKLDPSFAPASASLALALLNQLESGEVSGNQVRQEIRNAAMRAIALAPSLPDGYAAMGKADAELEWDWMGAQAMIDKALALDPNHALALAWKSAIALWWTRRFDEAIAVQRRTISTDPVNWVRHWDFGETYIVAGKYSEATEEFRTARALNPKASQDRWGFSTVLLLEGDAAAALAENEREVSDAVRDKTRVLIYHALGRKADADAAMASYEAKYAATAPYSLATINAYRGRIDVAFMWLARAIAQRDTDCIDMAADPFLKNLRTDPRFKASLRRVNLTL
jgi:TolB-like protein